MNLASPIDDLAIEGQMLYAITANNRLHVIDISGFNAIVRSSVALPTEASRIFVANGIAYIANGIENTLIEIPNPLQRGGYSTVDVSNPDAPTVISSIDTPEVQAGNLKTITNGSGLALIAGGFRGLQIHSANNPENTYALINEIATPGTANSVALAGGIAFVADDTAGLQVINYLSFDNQGVAPTVTINPSDIDLDPNTEGIQVQEGTNIPIFATITDDVQVRNVELLVNGEVVRNDVAFPFDFSAVIPNLAEGSDTVTIEVRATDTGGNSTISDPLILDIKPHIFAPTLDIVNPVDGTVRGRNFRTIRLGFSEGMDTSTLNADNIYLSLKSDDNTPIPSDIQYRNQDRVVQFTYDALVPGEYDLIVDSDLISDRSGNALGTGLITVCSFTVLDATAVWINPADGFWDEVENWETEDLPQADDDVFISVPEDITITHRTGNTQINSLTTTEKLNSMSSTIDIISILELHNEFTLNGSTLKNATVLTESNGFITATSNSNNRLSGVTVNITELGTMEIDGGTIRLNGGLIIDTEINTSQAQALSIGSNSNNRFSGVTINGEVKLKERRAWLTIENDTIINGSITL